MATTLRIKRRAAGGAAGAPSALKTSEIAYNETDDILYIGYGDDGSANATSIRAVAGAGAFVRLVTDQTIAGLKTFSSSPILPTPAPGDNTTKAATTAFVTAAIAAIGGGGGTWGAITGTLTNQTDLVNYIAAQIAALVGAAPGTLDTLAELAAALNNNENFAANITASVNARLLAANNLADLTDPTYARTIALGCGTLATQNANAVAITGGTIDGVVIDGGVF
jgi:hypothetical protein